MVRFRRFSQLNAKISNCLPAEPDQSVFQLVVVFHDSTPSQSKIPIKPSVPQTTTIGLHAELEPTELFFFRDGFDFQARAVCVGSDD